MRQDVLYIRKTTQEPCWYSKDTELNYDGSFIEAVYAEEAESLARDFIAELMRCNCLEVEETEDGLMVFEPSDHEFIEGYVDFSVAHVQRSEVKSL